MQRRTSSSPPEARSRPQNLPRELEARSVPGLPQATLVLLPQSETRSSKASDLRRVMKERSSSKEGRLSSRGLWVWQTPVTCRQYAEVTGKMPASSFSHPDAPVERVSLFEALLFCDELSQRLNLPTSFNKDYDWRFSETIISSETNEGLIAHLSRLRGFRLPFVDELRRMLVRSTPKPSESGTLPYRESTGALVKRLRRTQGAHPAIPSPDMAPEGSQTTWFRSEYGDVFEWTLTPGDVGETWMFVKAGDSDFTRRSCLEGYHRIPQVGFRPVLVL